MAVPPKQFLGFENIRRFPRLNLTDKPAPAILSTPDLKTKTTVPVYEVSEGGVLVDWPNLPIIKSKTYPIIMRLKEIAAPIIAHAEIRYAVSKGKNQLAGLSFVSIAREQVENLKRFIESRIGKSIEPPPDPDTGLLQIFFQTRFEWKREYEQNIRHGSLFIRTSQAYDKDHPLVLRLLLPFQSKEFILKGNVVYCWQVTKKPRHERPYGIGLKLDLTFEQLKLLKLTVGF